MKELGVKHNHMMASPKVENSKSYPSTSIDHKAGMKLKHKKVGHTGHMKVKYKVTGQNAYRDGTGHTSLDLTHAEDLDEDKKDGGSDEQAEGE